jgi:hypothetical protein
VCLLSERFGYAAYSDKSKGGVGTACLCVKETNFFSNRPQNAKQQQQRIRKQTYTDRIGCAISKDDHAHSTHAQSTRTPRHESIGSSRVTVCTRAARRTCAASTRYRNGEHHTPVNHRNSTWRTIEMTVSTNRAQEVCASYQAINALPSMRMPSVSTLPAVDSSDEFEEAETTTGDDRFSCVPRHIIRAL